MEISSLRNPIMANYKKTVSQRYEVFINFRGEELRQSFFTHLQMALITNGVNVYGDREHSRGVDPKSLVFKRIEESRIALAIFSSKYTESSWCLDELVKIKERVNEGKLMVLPIFYKLNPSEVKGLEGDFGLNLWNHVKHTSKFDKFKKWKEALDFVSQKEGLVLTENSDENEFIATIVEKVKRVTLISEVETNDDDQLSIKQHKNAFMDVTEESKWEDRKSDALQWAVKPNDNQEEYDSIRENYFKSRKDDGSNPRKDAIFLGEADSDAAMWDAKSYTNTEEAENIRGEAKMYSKSRSNESPDPRKDDIFLGEENSDVFLYRQDSVEGKDEKSNQSSTMAAYGKNPPLYQVFINFRGEDVGFSFVSHLQSALLKKGIRVFIDQDEKKGEYIGKTFKKIEDSKIALVVFSSKYSESKWCLHELLKIKECMDEGKLKVIPIYYKVKQSDVQQLNGDFGSNLWNMWRLTRDTHIIKWKETLESVARHKAMMCFSLTKDSMESKFVASIVEEVNKVLHKISLHDEQNLETIRRGEESENFPNKDPLFGMEQRLEQLEQKLDFDCNETRIVGIVGMPGIGKTTLAMKLYDSWNCKFVRCVPLLDIRKKLKDYGPVWLRTTLLKVLLGGGISTINEETTFESVKNELLETKVLLILDDVSDKKQFEFLLGDLKWIKKGSKIVITTCDKSLLEGLAHDTYLVPQIDNKDAFELFKYHVLEDQRCSILEASMTRFRAFVDKAGGNPLALKLMGSELRGKDMSHWEHKLQTSTKILDVWKFYFDQLNELQKDVFLDIASFFKSEDEYFVRSILDSGDPDSTDPVSEVTELVNKSLITISASRVEMHDLVYTFGKQLGSQGRKNYDFINKLAKLEEFGTANVRGVFLDMSKVKKSIDFEPSTFTTVSSLRYLKIYDSYCPRLSKQNCRFNLPRGLDFPLKELRYLHWVKYPLEELPSDFTPDNLVDLRLPYSKIKRVWKGIKDTPKLKRVDLSHSRNLLKLSGLSKAKNIQRLSLEGCTSLDELPSDIQKMKSLVYLNMRGCIRLWSLPKMNLTSLKVLILSDCSNLKEFQLTSKSIEYLHLDGTAINKLPPTIANLTRLVLLNLKNCKLLECIPNCLNKLENLEELILSGCSRLKNLPDVKHSMQHLHILRIDGTGAKEMPNISSFTSQASGSDYSLSIWPHGVTEVSSLGRLCLSGNDFVSLQCDISKLYNLKWLEVKHCKMLISIPMLPPRLRYFDAHGCGSLQRVYNPLALQVLTEHTQATFNFSNCKNLDLEAQESIISYTQWRGQLVVDVLSRYNGDFDSQVRIGTCFPGWKVPAWFSYRGSGSVLKKKLPSHWCDNKFSGIALCAVILFAGNHVQKNHLLVKCTCEFKNRKGTRIRFIFIVGGWSEPGNTPQKIESSHVFIGNISRMDINKHGAGKNEEGCIFTEASLQFQVTDGTKDVVGCEVLKCGFSLVYASDERSFVIPKRVEMPNMLSPVGVEVRLKQLEKVLYSTPGETRIIGVVGAPGIGKTTLATILFKKRGCKFPSNLFFSISKEHQPERLRKLFFEELLKETINDETTHDYVKDKLLQTKTFIVLDGVSHKKHIDFLLGNLNWIKKGSKIIITTRDTSYLEGFAHDTYMVPELNNNEAFQLFTYHAFEDHICTPTRTFLNLSMRFAGKAGGNPLALKLLGIELRGKNDAQWEKKLQTLTSNSVMNTRNHEESLPDDQLNEQHKDVFLDIVRFFRSEDEYFVRSILDSGNQDTIDAISEVKDLADSLLIEISNGRVEMDDIVYMSSMDLDSPGRYRLTNYEDINDKLKYMEKAEANNVRGIFIDMSEITKTIALEPMTFTSMDNLRYLKIYDSCCPQHCKPNCKLYFPDGIRFSLKDIRYFHWLKYPLNELPSDFRPENLVDLRLPYSKIERLWEDNKELPRLKWVDLSHSRNLLNLSAFSKAENLQRLNLEGCTALDELPLKFQNMKSLVYLNLRGCVGLQSLPEMNLISLEILILSNCSNLKEFQLISERLEFLFLDETPIKGLPPAIKKLQRLVVLNMRNCKMLEFLPDSLCELKFLEELILSGCSMLKNFPYIKQSMTHLQVLLFDGVGAEEMPNISCFTRFQGQAISLLQRLCLSGNDFVSLQADIGILDHLKWLDVKHCKKLRSVPVLPPRLQYFNAHGCDSLENVANPLALTVATEQIHATFNFSNCNKLSQDARDSIISYTWRKIQLVLDALSRYHGSIASEALMGTCFPGWEVPAWFSHRASGSGLKSKLPPHWFDNRFTGIALCAVIQFPRYNNHNNLYVRCTCVCKTQDGIHIRFSSIIGVWSESGDIPQKMESSHIFMGYVRRLDVNKHEERCTFYVISLDFQVINGTGEIVVGCEVQKCGFNLVYAPDERENISWEGKVSSAALKQYEKSRSDKDIQYQSYSCPPETKVNANLRRDDNFKLQRSHSLNPERIRNVLGEVPYLGKPRIRINARREHNQNSPFTVNLPIL